MRVIDTSKCIGCGKCVNDCVNKFLQLSSEGDEKKASFVDRGRCLDCGHCNAICPQEAISGGKLAEKNYKDDLLSLMSTKRTVRSYTRGLYISDDELDRIVYAGQSAPTNRNRRSARIILIKDILEPLYNKALDYLVESVSKDGTINPLYVPTMRMNENRSEVLWNAEYLVVFAGLPQNNIDAAIAAERMQLEAHYLGIGSAYRGDMVLAINNVNEIRNMLEIKSNEEALVAFTLGKTDLKYYRPAVKINRKVIFK